MMSNRHYLMWSFFIREEFNKPSRTDFYLMQIAAEIRRIFAKDPSSVLLQKLKILFKWSKPEPVKQLTAAEVAARDKALLFPFIFGVGKGPTNE